MFGDFAKFVKMAENAQVMLRAIFNLVELVASQNASTPQEHARIAAAAQQVKDSEVA